MRNTTYLFFLLLLVSSCKKFEDKIVPGNIPPPDHTVDSATILIYVNKAYINLTGKEPLSTERSDALTILRQNNFSVDNRKQFIETLFTKSDYNRTLYNRAAAEYLANTDSADIEAVIYQYNYILTLPQYAPFYSMVQTELNRLDTFKRTVNDMNAGVADYREMLIRCVNNYFYDQVNMGTENFVISTFQNFLFRYPDSTELSRAKLMVDGLNSTSFFQTGKTKYDYIHIFFNSTDYYEGQVRYVFKKYLFREPSPAEIAYYGDIYKSSNSFKNMLKEILSLDEYAGIE